MKLFGNLFTQRPICDRQSNVLSFDLVSMVQTHSIVGFEEVQL